jgi:integrase
VVRIFDEDDSWFLRAADAAQQTWRVPSICGTRRLTVNSLFGTSATRTATITKGRYEGKHEVEVLCKTDPVCGHSSLHRLRKTCATNWQANEIPVRTVQHYLGHKSLEVPRFILAWETQRNNAIALTPRVSVTAPELALQPRVPVKEHADLLLVGRVTGDGGSLLSISH